MTRALSGLSEIAHLYDGFILDLWGVMHDGVKPFPATVPALLELKRAGRKVWLLSNAPRRASAVVRHMEGMGIPRDLYGGIVTSGEAAHDALRDELLEKWGRRCFRLGLSESLCDGLDMSFADTPDNADFMLVEHVFDIMSDPARRWEPVLRACAEKKLPMLCPNPDKVVHAGGSLIFCPGTLADIYESMGGPVTYFGKPHRAVYSRCLEDMGAKRVLAVGDGMETDIAGAAAAGLDSALVVSGIHRDEISDNENHLQDFFVKYLWRPSYLLKGLIW